MGSHRMNKFLIFMWPIIFAVNAELSSNIYEEQGEFDEDLLT